MKLLREYKEHILIGNGKSGRTVIAYGKHVENFLLNLRSKYEHYECEIGAELITKQEMQSYLLSLQNGCVSVAVYAQAMSALSSLCLFLRDRYKITGIELPESRIVASFPIACSESKILEILNSLGNSFEDIRMHLIIRLLYVYKVSLLDIVDLKKGFDDIDIINKGKHMRLSLGDRMLLGEYLEKLALHVHGKALPCTLFVVIGRYGTCSLTYKIIWSLLKRVFIVRRKQHWL